MSSVAATLTADDRDELMRIGTEAVGRPIAELSFGVSMVER